MFVLASIMANWLNLTTRPQRVLTDVILNACFPSMPPGVALAKPYGSIEDIPLRILTSYLVPGGKYLRSGHCAHFGSGPQKCFPVATIRA